MKVLMVSTEYPPIPGGVGRYTKNLVTGLKKAEVGVYVLCNEKGNGDFFGLDPVNPNNSKVILDVINKLNPDVVHIQLEHGLYGLKQLYSHNLNKSVTNIDEFYDKCQIPIITTFHSAYPFRQWIKISKLLYHQDNVMNSHLANPFEKIKEYWMRFMSYYSFNRSNKIKMKKSSVNIVFSNYLASLILGNNGGDTDKNMRENNFSIIYHGAEPNLPVPVDKREARNRFHLPLSRKIGLFFGFATYTKGWEILNSLNIPDDWTIVVNQSKNLYGTGKTHSIEILDKEDHKPKGGIIKDPRIINLGQGFLSDTDLSTLLYASETIILPYTVTSGSGVMFDALGHGVPFIASDLGFFKEFEKKGLGITVKRKPHEFEHALRELESNYSEYVQRVKEFKTELKWDNIASQHLNVYEKSIRDRRMNNEQDWRYPDNSS